MLATHTVVTHAGDHVDVPHIEERGDATPHGLSLQRLFFREN